MTAPGDRCVFNNGGELRRAVRQEIRTLSDSQRQRLLSVMQQLKRNGQYDQFSEQHRQVGGGRKQADSSCAFGFQVGASGGAHSGPGR